MTEFMKGSDYEGYGSYIAASYVHWLEGSGAKVVPLYESEGLEAMLKKVKKLNGVLFPGGGSNCRVFAGQIYEAIKELNDQGQYYPIWGTCLGF